MKTYWDFTEKERSEMTTEQVEALLKFDLMEFGVIKLEEPQYMPEDVVKPPFQKLFYLRKGYGNANGIAYKTAADAQEAAKAVVVLDYEYIGHEHYHTIAKNHEVEIAIVEVFDRMALAQMRSQMEKCKEAIAYNKKLKEEHDNNVKAVHDATKGIWEDYSNMQYKARVNKRLIDTYNDYLATCDNNQDVAIKFLRKAYSDDAIEQAFEWFELASPFVAVAQSMDM